MNTKAEMFKNVFVVIVDTFLSADDRDIITSREDDPQRAVELSEILANNLEVSVVRTKRWPSRGNTHCELRLCRAIK